MIALIAGAILAHELTIFVLVALVAAYRTEVNELQREAEERQTETYRQIHQYELITEFIANETVIASTSYMSPLDPVRRN